MYKTNIRVREAMNELGMTQKMLAEILNISETTIFRKLKKELPEEEQNRLLAVIYAGTSADKLDSKYRSETICWHCRRAVAAKCSWAREFKPVDGWIAERRERQGYHNARYISYTVLECPEYEEG